MLAAAAATLTMLGAPAVANADKTITTAGPINKLWVGSDLACQVSYAASETYEFYPPEFAPGDCGSFVTVDSTVYAPDLEAHGRSAADDMGEREFFTPVNETLTGSGTGLDPYVITTDVTALGGSIAIQQRTSYVTGQSSYKVDISVRNNAGSPHLIRVYYAGDCYASGSDIGFGFVRPEIKSFGCSQNADNNPAARTIQLVPRSPGSAGVEDRFWRVWERIGDQSDFDNSCLCAESVDNGVGLQWKTSLASSETGSFSLQVAFSESQTAPLTDSDGDALPDAWESGQAASADAENLATLGADPARKDIFVHADWMAGCTPTPGWEQRAIAMFAEQGISLHVDSGPTSINANGQPWGALSRAGQVDFAPVVDLRNGWMQVDAFKDRYFGPSGRRRAFHYVLFAEKLWDVDDAAPNYAGISRGIPDSDVLIANCHMDPPPAGQPATPRADTTYFVHELGHNLGLRHGGFEHFNNKPNYYSLMNYSWAKWALANESRFVPFSKQLYPTIDETHIDEHGGLVSPIAYYCDKGRRLVNRTESMVLTDADFDCDNTYGERDVKANLSGNVTITVDATGKEVKRDDIFETSLLSFNDWSAITFTGGGIVGALSLPLRADVPAIAEITRDEVAAAAVQEAAATKRMAKQIVVVTKTRQLRKPKNRKRSNTVKVTVKSLTGRTIRNAVVTVRGGRYADGRKKLRTDRRGRLTLRVKLTSKKQLQVTAARSGYQRSKLLIPVVKK